MFILKSVTTANPVFYQDFGGRSKVLVISMGLGPSGSIANYCLKTHKPQDFPKFSEDLINNLPKYAIFVASWHNESQPLGPQ